MTDPLSSALEKLDRWSEYAIGQRNRAEASKLSEHYADEEHHMTRAIAIEAVVSDLRASLAAAVERAERAERERDEWRHRCGCTPECELHCCSQDCDNAGAEEASWRGAWDLLDEARAALSSALSRAEALEGAASVALAWLSEQEWCGWRTTDEEDVVGSSCCDECGGPQDAGHEQGCALAHVLTRLRSLLSSPPPTKQDAPNKEDAP